MNEQPTPRASDADSGAGNTDGSDSKSRPVYDTTVSEGTRELRETSRRRRDAEEKLQQHLMEAKDHVPHHHDQDPQQEDTDPGAGKATQGVEPPAGAKATRDTAAEKDPGKDSEATRDREDDAG